MSAPAKGLSRTVKSKLGASVSFMFLLTALKAVTPNVMVHA